MHKMYKLLFMQFMHKNINLFSYIYKNGEKKSKISKRVHLATLQLEADCQIYSLLLDSMTVVILRIFTQDIGSFNCYYLLHGYLARFAFCQNLMPTIRIII